MTLQESFMKKVLYLSPLPPPAGGIPTWTKRILSLPLPDGWIGGVVDTKVIGKRTIFSSGKPNFVEEAKRAFRIICREISMLRDEGYIVMHINSSGSKMGMLRDSACAVVGKLFSRKIVIHFHCTVSNVVVSKSERIVLRILLSLADAIIVLNSSSESYIKKVIGKQSYVVPNFLDKARWGALPARAISDHISRALFVGGGILSKGCGIIIEAAKCFPEIEFRIAGDISKELRNSNLPENVLLLNEIKYEKVIQEMLDSDVFLFPTFFRAEGFSMALLEAMASGLPCIATDWAANRHMLEDKGGILIPVKQYLPLVEALRKMRDPAIRKEMSKWNQNKVRSCYLDEQVLGQLTAIYNRLTQELPVHEQS